MLDMTPLVDWAIKPQNKQILECKQFDDNMEIITKAQGNVQVHDPQLEICALRCVQ